MTGVVTAAGPQYSNAPIRRSHKPPKARPFAEYRNCLRFEFAYTCAYCLASEREVGPSDKYGGFEIEHFKPRGVRQFRNLRCYYPNLLWACHACNRAKSDTWPSVRELANGVRFIDPCVEPLGKYLSIRGDKVVALTSNPAGQYMIDEVNLNSAQHVQRRQRRQKLARNFALLEATAETLRRRIKPGMSDEAETLAELDTLTRALNDLRLTQGVPPSPPWDAPTDCRCASR